MKYNKGFTLVELIIVIVIVAVLSIVSVPIYEAYIERARATEVFNILPSIIRAQKFYVMENGNFAENILDLGIQIDGTEKVSDSGLIIGTKTIRTKYFEYLTGQGDETDERLISGYVGVYRRGVTTHGFETVRGFTLRLSYVKQQWWIDGVKVKPGDCFTWPWSETYGGGAPENMDREMTKLKKRFVDKIW